MKIKSQNKTIFKKPVQLNLSSLNNPTLPHFTNLKNMISFPKIKLLNESKECMESELISKKRGRKIKNSYNDNDCSEEKKINDEINIHDKFSNDNMKRKIKTFYHNYIINLLNNIIKKKYQNNKMKFLKINKRKIEDLEIE